MDIWTTSSHDCVNRKNTSGESGQHLIFKPYAKINSLGRVSTLAWQYTGFQFRVPARRVIFLSALALRIFRNPEMTLVARLNVTAGQLVLHAPVREMELRNQQFSPVLPSKADRIPCS